MHDFGNRAMQKRLFFAQVFKKTHMDADSRKKKTALSAPRRIMSHFSPTSDIVDRRVVSRREPGFYNFVRCDAMCARARQVVHQTGHADEK